MATLIQTQISSFLTGKEFKSASEAHKAFNTANNSNVSYMYFKKNYHKNTSGITVIEDVKAEETTAPVLAKVEPLVNSNNSGVVNSAAGVSDIGFTCDNPIIDKPKAVRRKNINI